MTRVPSLIMSFPTIVHALHIVTSSSSVFAESVVITPFKHPVSRKRRVIARVSMSEIPTTFCCSKYVERSMVAR